MLAVALQNGLCQSAQRSALRLGLCRIGATEHLSHDLAHPFWAHAFARRFLDLRPDRRGLGLWPRSHHNPPQRARVGLKQAPQRVARPGSLVFGPYRPNLAVRAGFEHVHPALDFADPDDIGDAVLAPEIQEDRLDPNPNLGPMILLMLRR